MIWKKTYSWILAVALFCGLATVPTSCSDEHISSGNGEQTDSTAQSGFFSDAINKMIDENYELVKQNGYAKLVIPASMYDTAIVRMPQYHKDVMAAMNKLDYETYVNGGVVRDAVLGMSLHDVDFSTDATPEEMKEKLTGFNVVITKTGGGNIAQVKHSNGDKTDMVPMRGIYIELKGKPGVPSEGAFGETYSKSLLDDTYSRDLTINSLYYDNKTGDIIDYHGGLHDLRDHIVRTVYDGNLMYPLNPASLIRTVRFAARYNFTIAPATVEAIDAHIACCDKLTPSLLSFYVDKGFGDGCASRTFQFYVKYGIYDRYVPMLKDFLHSKDYTDKLYPALDYLDEQKKTTAKLVAKLMFLPLMERTLGSQEWTKQSVMDAWNELETDTKQADHYLAFSYTDDKATAINEWCLYRKMTTDATLSDKSLTASVRNDRNYNGALLLLTAFSKGDSSLQKYLDYWNSTKTTKAEFFTDEVNKLIDANYAEVQKNGYAKLVIPRSLYKGDLFDIPANAKSDMDALVKAGYKVYVNGGSVRDAVLGTPSADVDISTDCGIDDILKVLPNAKSFHAFSNIWVVKAYHDGGLATDIAPLFSIFPDLSGKNGIPVSKYPDSPYCDDPLEDTYSRDFTFNALYYDYATGDIIDYHGGLHDLRDGIVNTNIDANFKLSFDPRPYFRACRFAAKYNFSMSSALHQALRKNTSSLDKLDADNAVYQTVDGFEDGYAGPFYNLLNQYRVMDYLLTSMGKWQKLSSYHNFVRGMLNSFDANGKVDMALVYAALFWPRVTEELANVSNPTAKNFDAIWDAIDRENAKVLRFEKVGYGDYSYAPQFMKDVWLLQTLMTNDANMTAAKKAEIKAMSHYSEALCFLSARANNDSSLKKYVTYWKK